MTHELSMNEKVKEKAKKMRTIVVKSMANKDVKSDTSKKSKNDDKMAMIIRKFKRFIRRKRYGPKKKGFSRGD